jgi:hypothetical protein
VFDEKAYGRPLNRYLDHPPIARPIGYVNSGSGSTWTFNGGTITPQMREAIEIKVCRSPGDVASYQHNWPNTNGISCYNDVGTSYLLNMMWWNQTGWPGDFTQHYNAGTERIRRTGGAESATPYAWIADQHAAVIANSTYPNIVLKGEFGGTNMSVLGFLTGDAAYTQIKPQAGSGNGYSFLLLP